MGMKDTKLYEQLLGINPPWSVTKVTLNKEAGEIEVEAACAELVWACPQCQGRMRVNGYERRRWRHLDSCQYKTYLAAAVPRVICEQHGSQMVAVPWAEPYSRFTRLFERLAIDLLLECSVAGACGILGLNWNEADGIKQRAVKRGLKHKAPVLSRQVCVDEKAAGHGHDYLTIVIRADKAGEATVEHLGDGRDEAALDGYFQGLSPEQLAGIQAMAMDLWKPYLASARRHLPKSEEKIVHDAFHLVRHLNNALNDVRKAEHRQLKSQGDERLKATRFLWLKGLERLDDEELTALEKLKRGKLRTARAWALKEMFRDFFKSRNRLHAQAFFRCWYDWAIRSRLEPVKKVARMFRAHLANILTYFDHRLTNAAAEGINNKIQGLIQKAFGYRNRERFKTDILFHLGGLDLYPITA